MNPYFSDEESAEASYTPSNIIQSEPTKSRNGLGGRVVAYTTPTQASSYEETESTKYSQYIEKPNIVEYLKFLNRYVVRFFTKELDIHPKLLNWLRTFNMEYENAEDFIIAANVVMNEIAEFAFEALNNLISEITGEPSVLDPNDLVITDLLIILAAINYALSGHSIQVFKDFISNYPNIDTTEINAALIQELGKYGDDVITPTTIESGRLFNTEEILLFKRELESEIFKASRSLDSSFPNIILGVRLNTYDDYLSFLSNHNLIPNDILFPEIDKVFRLLLDRNQPSKSQARAILKGYKGVLSKPPGEIVKKIPEAKRQRVKAPIEVYKYNTFIPYTLSVFELGKKNIYRIKSRSKSIDFNSLEDAEQFVQNGGFEGVGRTTKDTRFGPTFNFSADPTAFRSVFKY